MFNCNLLFLLIISIVWAIDYALSLFILIIVKFTCLKRKQLRAGQAFLCAVSTPLKKKKLKNKLAEQKTGPAIPTKSVKDSYPAIRIYVPEKDNPQYRDIHSGIYYIVFLRIGKKKHQHVEINFKTAPTHKGIDGVFAFDPPRVGNLKWKKVEFFCKKIIRGVVAEGLGPFVFLFFFFERKSGNKWFRDVFFCGLDQRFFLFSVFGWNVSGSLVRFRNEIYWRISELWFFYLGITHFFGSNWNFDGIVFFFCGSSGIHSLLSPSVPSPTNPRHSATDRCCSGCMLWQCQSVRWMSNSWYTLEI